MEVGFYRSASGRSPVREFLDHLSKPDQARFADVAEGIEQHGLACPRVRFRQLDGKLWEIKFATATGKFRIAYVVVTRELMIWLHVFKKARQRTPGHDLEVARQRLREVMET